MSATRQLQETQSFRTKSSKLPPSSHDDHTLSPPSGVPSADDDSQQPEDCTSLETVCSRLNANAAAYKRTTTTRVIDSGRLGLFACEGKPQAGSTTGEMHIIHHHHRRRRHLHSPRRVRAPVAPRPPARSLARTSLKINYRGRRVTHFPVTYPSPTCLVGGSNILPSRGKLCGHLKLLAVENVR